MAEDMGALKSWMLSKISWDLSLAKDWERLMDEFLAEYAARQIRAYMDIMQTAAVESVRSPNSQPQTIDQPHSLWHDRFR
jgi:hypothetical protein